MTKDSDQRRGGTSAESDEVSEVEESSVLGSEEEDDEAPRKRREDKIIRLMPIHNVVGASKGITRSVGRPRKVERRPTESDLEYHAEMIREKAEFVESDSIVNAIQKRADAAEMLQRIKEEIARESASLHFQRIENEKLGRDSAQVSTRRIDALRKIAEIELEIKRMGADIINLRSEKMQKLFKFFVEGVRECCIATGMTAEQADLLFNKLGKTFDGWEERAAELVR